MITAPVLFLVLAVLARSTAYFPIDILITQSFQALQLTGLGPVMYLVSLPGYIPQIFLITAIAVFALYFIGLQREAVASLFAAGMSQVVNILLKFIIQRPRPSNDLVDVLTELRDYSFPSGHVMFYVGFFGFLAFLCLTFLKPSLLRTVLLAFFITLVILVGPSRVYLGEHWASDVLGGYLAGSLTLVLSIRHYRRNQLRGNNAVPNT